MGKEVKYPCVYRGKRKDMLRYDEIVRVGVMTRRKVIHNDEDE